MNPRNRGANGASRRVEPSAPPIHMMRHSDRGSTGRHSSSSSSATHRPPEYQEPPPRYDEAISIDDSAARLAASRLNNNNNQSNSIGDRHHSGLPASTATTTTTLTNRRRHNDTERTRYSQPRENYPRPRLHQNTTCLNSSFDDAINTEACRRFRSVSPRTSSSNSDLLDASERDIRARDRADSSGGCSSAGSARRKSKSKRIMKGIGNVAFGILSILD